MFIKTFIIALVLIFLSLVGLAIGYLITGKTKLQKRCGKLPKSEKCDKDQENCEICSKGNKKKE